MVKGLAWFGSACLVIAPFVITDWRGIMLAITGLLCLMPQAWEKRLHNLLVLNVAGVLGYTFSLWSLI